ncbi:MAG TPA: CBS domain-containing protein [Candidatus Nanoarchaeia archaeon]|nr:CBS domain-containing protein [Candidatus Nanoarchaeia archaeon]
MVYFSQIRNSAVFDSHGKEVGKLKDLIFVDGKENAAITHLTYSSEDRTERKLSWSLVEEIKGDRLLPEGPISIKLNTKKSDIHAFFVKEGELRVSSLLDKQVVDIKGLKVVRVNDVLLAKVDGSFSIIAVCIGSRSFFRRLGFLPAWVKDRAKESIIPWRSVEALHKPLRDIHLKVQKQKIADLHPEDIADIMEDLNPKDANLIFNSLNLKKQAQTLIELDPDRQPNVIREFKKKRIVEFLEEIPPEQAADILELFPKYKRTELLTIMDKKVSHSIAKILRYPEESAGTIMETDFVAVPENFTVKQTLEFVRKNPPSSEKLYHLYTVDSEGRLTGIIPIRRILLSPPRSKVSEIKKSEVIYVETTTSHEDMAKTMSRYDLFVLPVVTKRKKKLVGVVTADDVMAEIMPQQWRTEKHKARKIRQNGA